MESNRSIELIPAHQQLWEHITRLQNSKCFPQAILLIGPEHVGKLQFTNRLIAMLICEGGGACGRCKPCRLLVLGTHPDVQCLGLTREDRPIRVEHIRDLQEHVFRAPSLGSRRFIVIGAADRLNPSSSNALLKMLEEPPAHAILILIAEQISTIIPTILSRCQRYVFPGAGISNSRTEKRYFQLAQQYPDHAPRGILFKGADSIINSLSDLLEDKVSPCYLVESWSQYEYEDLLWFLYLLTAEMIHFQLVGNQHVSYWNKQLERFILVTKPSDLFKQLDQIHGFIRNIHHNISLNRSLALESLLIGYKIGTC